MTATTRRPTSACPPWCSRDHHSSSPLHVDDPELTDFHETDIDGGELAQLCITMPAGDPPTIWAGIDGGIDLTPEEADELGAAFTAAAQRMRAITAAEPLT